MYETLYIAICCFVFLRMCFLPVYGSYIQKCWITPIITMGVPYASS